MESTSYTYLILGTSFITGLAGNLHCVAMCGPLWTSWLKQRTLIERIVYHSLRIGVYALLGMIMGYTARGVEWLKYGYLFSIIFGIGWLIVLFVPFSFHFGQLYAPGKYLNLAQTRNRYLNMALKGAANAILPCGLLYAALTQGFISGSGMMGALALGVFGMGTLVSAFLFSGLLNALITRNQLVKWNIQKAISATSALLLILRGLNLGIPYISPSWIQNEETGVGKIECCSKPNH